MKVTLYSVFSVSAFLTMTYHKPLDVGFSTVV